MLDDHRRAERLRRETRTDRTVGERVQRFLDALQTRLVHALQRLDGEAGFSDDRWERTNPDGSPGGGGLRRVVAGGRVWETGVVEVSAVRGALPERAAQELGGAPVPCFATGLSLVLHPRNPYVPAVHAGFRHVALGDDPFAPADQWFGGEAVLLPSYPEPEDARHFHATWKTVCDAHPGVADYAAFKRACDAAFSLPHRAEGLGVGGICFEALRGDPEGAFLFVRQAGRAFLSAYAPLVERHWGRSYGERERAYQALRRGRYAEYVLTRPSAARFGEGVGMESIVAGLPPTARWAGDWRPDPGTPEAEAQGFFQPQAWL